MSDPLVGVYPGTFDPITSGHMDIIQRAARIVDRLVIGVASNAGKGPLFSLDERVDQVKLEIAAMGDGVAGRISVEPFSILLMHFARAHKASLIIRGLRAVSDFEYEFQMAGMNAKLDPAIETVFLMAADGQQFVSSRFVKEIGRLGGDISRFVSPRIAAKLAKRFTEGAPGEQRSVQTPPFHDP
jgi:pantetheine-phosphate adenylyltransferase